VNWGLVLSSAAAAGLMAGIYGTVVGEEGTQGGQSVPPGVMVREGEPGGSWETGDRRNWETG